MIDFRTLSRILYLKKWFFGGIVLTTLAAAFIYAFLLPKQYIAEAKVLLARDIPEELASSGIDPEILSSQDRFIARQVLLIEDPSVIGEVIKTLDLRNKEGLLIKYSDMLARINIAKITDTDIIRISVVSDNAPEAANSVNTLCREFARLSAKLNRDKNISLKSLYAGLQAKESGKLAEASAKSGVIKKKFKDIKLSDGQKDKISHKTGLLIARTRLAVSLAGIEKGSFGNYDDGSASRVRDQLVRTEKELKDADDSLRQYPEGERLLMQAFAQMKASTAGIAMLSKALYDLNALESLHVSEPRIISFAPYPERPAGPSVWYILLFGAISAVMLSFGAVFLIEYFDQSVKNAGEAREALNCPAVFETGDFTLDASDVRAEWAAGARLRENIGDMVRTGPFLPKNIALVFPGSGEKLSLLCALIARAFADGGNKTILLDADVKSGLQEKLFGIGNAPGLLECLAGNTPLSECVRDTDNEKLKVVSAGWKADPADETAAAAASDVLAGISGSFDKLIVAIPQMREPISVEFIKKADAVVLCLNAFETPRGAALEAKKDIENAGRSADMVVVSHINVRKHPQKKG